MKRYNDRDDNRQREGQENGRIKRYGDDYYDRPREQKDKDNYREYF